LLQGNYILVSITQMYIRCSIYN